MLKLQCVNLFKKVVKIMDNNYNVFRRAAVGGFNRQDVITYIEKMRNEFFDYKKEVEQTISQLNEKIRELESLCQADEKPQQEPVKEVEIAEGAAADPVSEINEATLKLRMVADDLCQSLCFFMEKVSENAISVVVTEQSASQETAEEAPSEITEAQPEEAFSADEECEASAEDEFCIEADEAAEQEENVAADAVEAIMAFADSFSFDVNSEKEIGENKDIKEEEKGDILNILDSAGFLI